MSSIDLFLIEFESQTVPYKKYRKHEETLLKYSIVQPDTINFKKYIALNPVSANKTGRFLCNLADKYKIKLTGEVKPFWVGPPITKFFKGMQLEKLLKWYEHYGFTVKEDNKIIREPK